MVSYDGEAISSPHIKHVSTTVSRKAFLFFIRGRESTISTATLSNGLDIMGISAKVPRGTPGMTSAYGWNPCSFLAATVAGDTRMCGYSTHVINKWDRMWRVEHLIKYSVGTTSCFFFLFVSLTSTSILRIIHLEEHGSWGALWVLGVFTKQNSQDLSWLWISLVHWVEGSLWSQCQGRY